MNCEKIQETFPDYLVGDLDDKTLTRVQAHLAQCDTCRVELENLSAAWTKLGVIPEQRPSDSLRLRFYTMLETYKQNLQAQTREPRLQQVLSSWLLNWWPRSPVSQFALTIVVLIAGLAGGYLLNSNRQAAADLTPLRQEISTMRQAVATSLLENQSASERIRGITMSYNLEQPGEDLLKSLLQTLDTDPNVNVRLAAVDALFLFRDHPVVKNGVVESITRQESPMVQLALIDLMVNLRESRAAEALRTLIHNNNLNEVVKQKAEEGLEKIL